MATTQELLDRAKRLGGSTTMGGAPTPQGGTGARLGGTPQINADLKTSQGLYKLATSKGLQQNADTLLARQAGESNKLFSGGFISDIFDVLNSAQYGVTGLLKGKGFVEGVRTRQSFSDKDALGDNGLPGVAAGILLDIAVDPFTYIAPWTVAKKITPLAKLAKAGKERLIGKTVTKEIMDAAGATGRTYQTLEGGTDVGRYLVQKLSWAAGKDPVFLDTMERGTRGTAIATKKIMDLGTQVSNITPDLAKLILKKDSTGRFVRESIENLSKVIPPDQLQHVTKLYNYIDNLGQQAVDLGLLSKEKYEANLHEYVKQAYKEYETAKKSGTSGYAAIGIKGIKRRKEGLTVEKMQELGQVDNPAYLLMKSAIDLTRDVDNAKLFKEVSERFGTDMAQDGFTKMPTGLRVGDLANKYIPDHMAEYLNMIIPSKNPLGELESKIVGNFKYAKVVLNPGTHARNIISNKILNYWKLGMNPSDPRTIRAEATALKEIAKGGGKWTDEATPLGYNLDTFASAELKNLLDAPEVLMGLKGLGPKASKLKKKIGDIYQAEENQAKLSAYIYQRTVEKLDPEAAWKAAESATFNYAQVTPFIRKLRESIFGFPFVTFTYKATPLALETIAKHPGRVSVIGKIKQGIEELSDSKETEEERANEPSWVRDGFYIKIPGKDEQGRSRYFDLTYILPFGDLVAGNYWERGQNMDTGTPETVGSAILRKSPFLQLVGEISKNRDFYGNKIMRDSDSSDVQMKDLFVHVMKSMAPPPISEQIPSGYNDKGELQFRGLAGATAADDNQKRNVAQELMRNFGVKIQPVSADVQESYAEMNRKKALETLLKEAGVINDMTISYQPKPKPEDENTNQ